MKEKVGQAPITEFCNLHTNHQSSALSEMPNRQMVPNFITNYVFVCLFRRNAHYISVVDGCGYIVL